MADKPTMLTFVSAIGRDWGSKMSGAASIPLGALAVFNPVMDLRWLWILTSIGTLWYAAYKTWAHEREHVIEAERISKSFVIHSAIWGAEGAIKDVTEIVMSRISPDGKLEMPCEIDLLGEAREFLIKTLTIDYSHEGERQKRSFREHEVARLP